MNRNKKVLITGSAGLIGSEAVRFFIAKGFDVIGVDNDMRAYFFGKKASTLWNSKRLEKEFKNYKHYLKCIIQSGITRMILTRF